MSDTASAYEVTEEACTLLAGCADGDVVRARTAAAQRAARRTGKM
jgi:hypothetical protein